MTLIELETYFNNIDLTKYNGIKLNEFTTILNVPLFVSSNIELLKNKSGNKYFLPYYQRLFKLYKLISDKNKSPN